MQEEENHFKFERPEESTGFLLWQATNLWQRKIKKALEAYQLTHTQFVLLTNILWFSHQEKVVTQIVLAEQTNIDPMTTSTVLKTLQKKGLIKRQEHSHDTRAKNVMLTEEGTSVTQQAIQAVEAFDTIFFGKLSTQQNEFNACLLKILKP